MEKIKQFTASDKGRDVLTLLIVVLVSLGSFGLGRLSKTETGMNSGVSVEYGSATYNQTANVVAPLNTNQIKQSSTTPKSTSGAYFASNRGSKYYSIGCSGGKTLKEENKIYFNSKEEAEKAGYELSSTCK